MMNAIEYLAQFGWKAYKFVEKKKTYYDDRICTSENQHNRIFSLHEASLYKYVSIRVSLYRYVAKGGFFFLGNNSYCELYFVC